MRKFLYSVYFLYVLVSIINGEVNRTALLIANNSYENLGNLENPVPEANELRKVLLSLNFEVILLENGNLEEMLETLTGFQRLIDERKGVSFFHYGGHAVQLDGNNYIIPSKTTITDESQLRTRALNLQEVMTILNRSNSKANIVVLDACRNNPFPTSSSRSVKERGLTVTQAKPKNSIIMYSAESNSVAMDGVFTPIFTEVLKKEGLSISEVAIEVRREVFRITNGRQIPGEYNQLFENIYLAGFEKKLIEQEELSDFKSKIYTNDKMLKLDYDKNLLLGNYFVGNYNQPLVKPINNFNTLYDGGWFWIEEFENQYGYFSEKDEKGFYPHIVDGGEALLLIGTVDGVKDLYYVDLKNRKITKLTNGKLGFKLFRDYNPHSNLILYSNYDRNEVKTGLFVIDKISREEKNIDLIEGKLNGACFVNDNSDLLYIYTDDLGNRHYIVYNNFTGEKNSILTEWNTSDSYISIQDVNYLTQKVLLKSGPVWNEQDLFILNIRNETKELIPEAKSLQNTFLSPNADYISYIIYDLNNNYDIQLGTIKLEDMAKNIIYISSGKNLQPYLFWLSLDKLGFVIKSENKTLMYKANTEGKKVYSVKLPSDFEIFRLLGQNHVTSYGLGCPQVYIKEENNYVFYDYILKNAKGKHNRITESISIPFSTSILLTEKLREVSFLHSIKITQNNEELDYYISDDVKFENDKIILGRGDEIEIVIDLPFNTKDDIVLTIDGYYELY